MTPETALTYSTSLWTEGERVRVTMRKHAPAEALEALRSVKPAILMLAQAAEQARCAEPLHVLVQEFRHDLEQMADGTWPAETVAEAIRMIGPGYGWTFTAEAA